LKKYILIPTINSARDIIFNVKVTVLQMKKESFSYCESFHKENLQDAMIFSTNL